MALCPRHDGLTVVFSSGRFRAVGSHTRWLAAAGSDVVCVGARGAGASRPSSLVPPGPTRSRGTSGSGEVSRIAPAFRGRVSRNWAPMAGRPHAVSQPP